jgi:hypothetical protein
LLYQIDGALYDKALALNPNAVIILRPGSANLNSKIYVPISAF